ncbi:MAG: hypothetical protein CM1200mP38_3420 [Dehalococcoidia bacterium]|nr:MAG: hypothetical protein CM1200mP38_3420 [Dehalococcoidia bacterium]
MRAGVYKGNSLIQTEEIPTPNPGPNQIVFPCEIFCHMW